MAEIELDHDQVISKRYYTNLVETVLMGRYVSPSSKEPMNAKTIVAQSAKDEISTDVIQRYINKLKSSAAKWPSNDQPATTQQWPDPVEEDKSKPIKAYRYGINAPLECAAETVQLLLHNGKTTVQKKIARRQLKMQNTAAKTQNVIEGKQNLAKTCARPDITDRINSPYLGKPFVASAAEGGRRSQT